MPLEAFAAVSLAGNILQFIETTKKLITTSKKLSQQGATERTLELEAIAQDIHRQAVGVTGPFLSDVGDPSEEDRSLLELASKCTDVAQQLLQVLERLKVKAAKGGPKWIFETLYVAILTEWRKEEVDELLARLDRMHRSIESNRLRDVDRQILRKLDSLAAYFSSSGVPQRYQDTTESRLAVYEVSEDRRLEDASRQIWMLASVAEKGLQFSSEKIILEQLRFDALLERYNTIHTAHDQTLSWLFDTRGQSSPATFSEWCTSEADTFWVTGKPGSGKSTLMKFLSEDTQTTKLLEGWAQPQQLVTAKFFYWNAGKTRLQKSHEGLLRSLIYQILQQCPEYILKIYPLNASAETNNTGPNMRQLPLPGFKIDLSVSALLLKLQSLCMLLASSDSRLCLFVDGLDEYAGPSDDVINLITQLRSPGNIKFVLSSRPWIKFESKYGNNDTTKLAMQDFNAGDIEAYARAKLSSDDFTGESEIQVPALVREIVGAANGVFLWVFLVVRSLKEGFENGDRIVDLQRRVRSYPSDLDEYFGRILFSDVDDFYRRHSAETFLVTLDGFGDLPLMAYWFMGEEDTDPDYAMNLDIRQLPIQRTGARLKEMRKRLNTYSKGLLEEHSVKPLPGSELLSSSILFDRKVYFLHRTVCDFLLLDSTKVLLRKWCRKDFDTHDTICKALLAQIKVSPCGPGYGGGNGPVTNLCTMFRDHYQKIRRSNSSLLREFDRVVESNWTAVAPETQHHETDARQARPAVEYSEQDDSPSEDQRGQSSVRSKLGHFLRKLVASEPKVKGGDK